MMQLIFLAVLIGIALEKIGEHSRLLDVYKRQAEKIENDDDEIITSVNEKELPVYQIGDTFDLNAETIIPVFIKIFHDQAEPDEWFYTFFRDENACLLYTSFRNLR